MKGSRQNSALEWGGNSGDVFICPAPFLEKAPR